MPLAEDRKFYARKSPTAVRTFGFNFLKKGWLREGEIITASSWSATPTGLTLSEGSFDDIQTGIKVAGGAVPQDYVLTNHFETNFDEEDDRSIQITISLR